MARPMKDVPLGGGLGYLSGSSMADIFGCGFRTPLQAYLRFIGQPSDKDIDEDTQRLLDAGNMMEEPAFRLFCKWYGYKGRKYQKAFFCPQDERIICHCDYILDGMHPIHPDGKPAIGRVGVEVKNTKGYTEGWGEPETDQVPRKYLIQCHVYMLCNACDEVWLIRWHDMRLDRYVIRKNTELESEILIKAQEFMDNCIKGIAPEAKTLNDAKLLFPEPVTEDPIIATEEIIKVYGQMKEATREESEAKKRKEDLKAKLLTYMAGHKILTMADGTKVCRYSKTNKTAIDSGRLKEERPEIYEEYLKDASFWAIR